MMEGSVMDGAMLSGNASMDPLQLHPLSRQGPRPLQVMGGAGPMALIPHMAVGGHETCGQLQQQQQCLGHEAKGIQRSGSSKCRASVSEEDEPSFTEDGTEGQRGKRDSPWQRMKWTDNNVRLLITAVMYMADEGETQDGGNKRKSGILQKKGKWKSVSKLMNKKGCPVSPQQCEDKFNDLNKRYKRLNDVLGKGIACDVVENPSLLEGMSLSDKAKDDVRKILSSKHLFYREMCAYHHGHAFPQADHGCQQANMLMQYPGRGREGHEMFRPIGEDGACRGGDENDDMEEEDGEDEDDEDDEDVEDEGGDPEMEGGGMGENMKRPKMNPNWEDVGFWASPESQDCGRPSAQDNLSQELMGMLQDDTKTDWQKRQWMRTRTMQLEEQKLQIQAQAFELEKQRIKWKRIKNRKDRELDRLKLDNERMKLENERMVLQLKHRELDLEFKRSEASSMSSLAMKMDRFRGLEQHDLGKGEPMQ
uniref:Myb/SANT-like DNA-binding domain-containing protein n=1 Tax=Araucaria cunninghamii TaxID=56994 RepID=A0A0D6R005_ARACU